MATSKDREYLEIILSAIHVSSKYKPKLGHGGKEGYGLDDFKQIYGNDPFYSWIGLDDPLMYAAHKAAGGMTSIYRQIGIGCEILFRQILQDTLGLTEADVKWSYTVARSGGQSRKLSLDARIPMENVDDVGSRKRIKDWIVREAQELEIDKAIIKSIHGVVFEIRQGYKSKDSKRQNADIANAATAYTKGYIPCAGILSQQIDEDIALRYRSEKWIILTGIVTEKPDRRSFYSFMRDIIGYDLASFFERNKDKLRNEVHKVLSKLLSPKN
jgi:hypothetical protein